MSDFDIQKIRRLDGGLLLVFRELLRTGRASVAAERLGLSPSAISHALNRLREVFDDPLFIRRPHGFEPTRRAEMMGPQVEELLDLANRAVSRDAAFDPAQSRRQFRFAAPEFVTALIGAQLFNRLREIAPKVIFTISFAAEDDAFRALRRGEIDFAIGRFGAVRPGYVLEPLFDDEYCVAARKDHPLVKAPLSEADWRSIGHIFAWSPSETAQEPDTQDLNITYFAEVPGWLTALTLAATTDGIVSCSRRLAERHSERLGLQVLDMPFPPNRIAVSVMRRSGARDAGVDWFLGLVKAAAEA